jgi:hypothetical protein
MSRKRAFQSHRLFGYYDAVIPKSELEAKFQTEVSGTNLEYLIAYKFGEDGNPIQTHFCLQNHESKIQSYNKHALDFNDHFSNFSSVQSNSEWTNKVLELKLMDENFLGDIDTANKRNKRNKDEKFLDACEYVRDCEKFHDIFKVTIHSEIISRKESFFVKMWNTIHQKPYDHKYNLVDFNVPAITDWSKSWFLTGSSACGKTHFALAHFKSPLLVNILEDASKYNPEFYDGIVFDDVNFSGIKCETLIHLLDVELSRDFLIKGIRFNIPANTKKIFTHNDPTIFKMDNIDMMQQQAIARRYNMMKCSKLFD